MRTFYFKNRNAGLNPDTTKYYFSTLQELIDQINVLKSITNEKDHIQWSVNPNTYNKDFFHLMAESWSTESRGTDKPLKCKIWFVCGTIHTDETDQDIYGIFPKWKADYRNHFIERRYLTSANYYSLSEADKIKVKQEGGVILHKFNFDND